MPAPILYCGDTNLEGAASYLAGLMTHFGWEFDYVPSDRAPSRDEMDTKRSLFIISDHPASLFPNSHQQIVVEQVERYSAGLLMIGGWESFCGAGGNWGRTLIGRSLPVKIERKDDRMNFFQPTLLARCDAKPHSILKGLPWDDCPPVIGGMNHVTAKKESEQLLIAESYTARRFDQGFVFECKATFPALVVDRFGKGRTAAFMSDVAPHWVGGFVDWGPDRVKAQAAGASAIEVGSHYAQFWKQLLAWVGRLE